MKPDTYTKKMKKHEESFDKLWMKIVNDTNDFIKDNPETTMYSLQHIEKFSDILCLSGAWVQDRINGKTPLSRVKGSLTRKIRKILGYNV